ncbi:PPE domain-containing protein [Nocardia pneumoniae]|uniref:PPE domain-containing protein n=1 Tax=Nocardia pneumoniae TaxID=228601 RepID=UPI00031F112C|nr:PPE domain-containing protein [Nocardia pneumoniae]
MVEPPVIGFTGVVWQARPTEQLARDLTTGPGAAPMADASKAWAKLAASFGAAVVEYEQIVAKIRESWRSGESEAVLERITKLRDWLVDAAAAASQNAAKAGAQAVAHEVARMAMPHVAEIAALEAAKRGIEQAGAALGAPLVAAAAQVDSEQDMAKANAARVMQSYEAAATPLAMPWQQQHPPVIATAAALEAETAAAQTTAATAAPMVPRFGGMPNLSGLSMPRAKTAYHAQTVSQAVAAPEVVPVEPAPVVTDNTASRMMPGAMAPGMGAGETERTMRAAAAAAPRPGEGLQIEAGFDAAPPVLGAAPEQARPESAPTEASS